MKQLLIAAFMLTVSQISNAAEPTKYSNLQTTSATVPFESAEITAVGDQVKVRWRADNAKSVTVFASKDPSFKQERIRIGKAGASGEVNAVLPSAGAGSRWFIELVPDRGIPLVISERVLGLPTAPNLRDIGGYRTKDGRWVRLASLYRSDQLDLLSDHDLNMIGQYGIGTVVDLRTEGERKQGPDRMVPGAKHIVLDMAGNQDPAPFLRAITEGQAKSGMVTVYRQLALSRESNAALGSLLREVLSSDRPLLFHCTAGKDRTGWATAVLLSLLGVSRETVTQDYLASTKLLEQKNNRILATVKPPFTAEQLAPVLSVDQDYLDAAFDEVEARYGSMEEYASSALGFGKVEIEALRDRLLVGSSHR